jgi:4'-phosphopantetheinyl transferase
VDVYRVPLDDIALGGSSNLLSPDEIARANRFRFPVHRERFIAGRAALRITLGMYLRCAPTDIHFAYTESGKPYLDGQTLSFNVSNSESLCLIAIGEFKHIGVDLEKVGPDKECEEIAKRFFAPGEVSELMKLDPTGRTAAFYACWTRKEAFVKAHGTGLVYGLDKFEVTVNPQDPVKLIAIHGEPHSRTPVVKGDLNDAKSWSLFDLQVDTGYAATLAVHGTVQRVLQMDWDGT